MIDPDKKIMVKPFVLGALAGVIIMFVGITVATPLVSIYAPVVYSFYMSGLYAVIALFCIGTIYALIPGGTI